MENETSNNGYHRRISRKEPETAYAKLPPQATELEDAVLGALMLEKDAYSEVCEILKPECFYKDANRTIYEAINDLAIKQEPIDMLTVQNRLQQLGKLEEVGGAYQIVKLTAGVSSSVHIEYHARVLAQKALARQLINFSTEIQRMAYEEKTDVDDIVQRAESELFKISNNSLKKDFVKIDPVIAEAIKRIEDAAKNTSGLSGIPSGFHKLDKMTSGWQRSDLIIIAARPAMGKTAFVLSMAKNMAEMNVPIAVFSLEMANVQLVNRLLVNVCEIPGEKIKNGKLESYEWEQLMQRSRSLESLPIYLDDSAGLSIMELNTKARRLVKDHNVKIIIIDYLQLMNASGMKFGSREQEVSMISRSLKQLAKELDIPIIALSQLNRGVEKTEDKRPGLADLRESGAIEQDADMVLFIHRPEYYKITEDKQTGESLEGIAEIIIAKHRNGAVGDVRLRFKKELARFQNLEDDAEYTSGKSFSSRLNGDSHISIASSYTSAPSSYPTEDPLAQDNSKLPF
ncbi:MAG: replicative DNA helicase [Paludibacteraceae bacterium]|nr:replicative DNA helicase [Paludibacteraceae bacterium]MEE3483189.1 replicative DNA helicase [Bacteroidales bacterium]